MRFSMFARLASAGLLLSIAIAPQARGKVSEAELAQISLNAISLCVHAALYRHDGLDGAALYHAALTMEHPVGVTPAERDCLWAKLHREGTLDRSGPNGRETRFNEALLLQVIAAYLTMAAQVFLRDVVVAV